MNTSTLTWFWPDGSPVDESRFDQGAASYATRPISKPCVSFTNDKYYLQSCGATGFVLCDSPLIKI